MTVKAVTIRRRLADVVSGQRNQTTTRSATPTVSRTAAAGPALLQLLFSGDCMHTDQRELPEDLLLVGRDVPEDNFCVDDSCLSRLHFRILWDQRASGYRLGDAGSSNGTFINGAQAQAQLLTDGDVIRAGDSIFLFREQDAMGTLLSRVNRAAATELTVLLIGETGVGKEVLARRIHSASGRKGDFVPVNCATLSRELAAAELFGHTRGAYSGATGDRPGLFRAADGGTLLLDELGDLPADVQPAILRALQERAIRPVGADREIGVDVRVLAATQLDLEEAASSGRFRPELYGRLSQLVLRVPPLRERREEVLPLLSSFVEEQLVLSPDAAEALLLWRWPYNIRELVSLANNFRVLCDDALLGIPFLSEYVPDCCAFLDGRPAAVGEEDPKERATDTRRRLSESLSKHRGNVSRVAEELGKPRAQIYRWLKAFGLSLEDFKG